MGDAVRLFTRVLAPNDAHPHGGHVEVSPTDPLPVRQTTTVFTAQAAVDPVALGALGDHLVLKTGPGALYSVNAATGAQAGWLLIFDAAAVPADGPVLPKKVYRVAAHDSFDRDFVPPLGFALGCVLVFSQGLALFNKQGSPAFLSGEAL